MRLFRNLTIGAVILAPDEAIKGAWRTAKKATERGVKVVLVWAAIVITAARLAVQWWQDQPWWTQTFLIFAAVLAVGVWLLLATLHRPSRQVGVAPRAERKPMPQWLRQQIADRDGWTCGICLLPIAKVDDLHIDHIHPVHAGGTDDPENLQASHDDCNRRKGGLVGWQPPYQRDAPKGWA